VHVGVNALLDLRLPPNLGNPPPERLESCTNLDLLALGVADVLLDPVVVQRQDDLVGSLVEALVFNIVVVLLRGLVVLGGLVLALDGGNVVVEGLVDDSIDPGPLDGGVAYPLDVELLLVAPLHLPSLRLLLGRNA